MVSAQDTWSLQTRTNSRVKDVMSAKIKSIKLVLQWYELDGKEVMLEVSSHTSDGNCAAHPLRSALAF